MKPHYDESGATLYHGDCLDVLASLPENSVDTVITDPPYHLTANKKGGTGAASLNPNSPAGRSRIGTGFMGKAWDGGDVAFRPETWAAVLRVAKPGAMLLAFGGSRTFHRLTCAIEDGGWEIRDCLSWLYGSGFPKSLDISKGIDKAGGASVKEQSALLRRKREAAGLTREQVAESVGCTPASVRDWEEGRARAVGRAIEYIVPRDDYREKLATLLGYTADERRVAGVSEDRRDDGTTYALGHSGTIRMGGNTAAAKVWQGWGTALKPAWEPIVLAMKPLDGTFVENAMAHGVAGLNVDGGRIEAEKVGKPKPDARREDRENWRMAGGSSGDGASSPLGRWPANVLLDAVAAELLDQSTGEVGGGDLRGFVGGMRDGGFANVGASGGDGKPCGQLYADAGGPSRFFYTAKASKSDRGHGNDHPTVKPTELMKYLCNLTMTPTRGVVLDTFAGSGTTLVAARECGRRSIGIELEAAHCAIIVKRLAQGCLFMEDNAVA